MRSKTSSGRKPPHHSRGKSVAPRSSLPAGRAVIGIHAVTEALRVRPRSVSPLWLRTGWQDSQELQKIEMEARSRQIRIEEHPAGHLDRLCSGHQGVLAFVNQDPELDWERLKGESIRRVVLLDGVEDPHNLGAILRTSWLLGVEAVFVPEMRAVHLSPAVSKVAQGALEHVPLEISSSMTQAIGLLKENGFWVFGLSHEARSNLYDLKLPEKVAWVLGSEGAGLRKPVERQCDELISIPQMDPQASFNVSVAAALALGETFRQHQILENPRNQGK